MNLLFINKEATDILNLSEENMAGASAKEIALKNDLLRRLINGLEEDISDCHNQHKKPEPLKNIRRQ